jgi:hypothetical protein
MNAEFFLERYTVCMNVLALTPFDSVEATVLRTKALLAYAYLQRAVAQEIPESAPAVPIETGDEGL